MVTNHNRLTAFFYINYTKHLNCLIPTIIVTLCSVSDDSRLHFVVLMNEINQDFKNLPLQEQFTHFMSNLLSYKICTPF